MEILKQKLKGKTQLVFVDFEGTESTHEMISIGAIKATLDFKGHFKRQYPLFYTLVKPSTPLTRFIIQFTKITQQDIDQKGVSLSEGIQKLVKYIGAASLKKSLVFVFAPHDFRLLKIAQSMLLDPKEQALIQLLLKNSIDFQAVLSQLMQDAHGNPLSLNNYLKAFQVEVPGQEHHAGNDALKLMEIYRAFSEKKNLPILREAYLNILSRGKGLPVPVRRAVKDLLEDKAVTREALLHYVDAFIEE